MPNMLDVGGQAPIMDPAEVARRQKLAQVLMQNGQDPGNMRHWSQALGALLNTGAGVYQGKQAAQGLAQGQQSGNKALADMLMGGDGKAAMANPYSADKAMSELAADRSSARSASNAERLLKLRMEAEAADPMRQWQMENMRSQIQYRNSGGAGAIRADQKLQAENEVKQQGKTGLSDQLGLVAQSYLKLNERGGVTNPDKGAMDNLGASFGTTSIGQTIGKMTGSENQSLRERINNARPLLIQGIRQATGMSARAMDSNRELEFYLQAATDPTKDLYSNLAALEVLDKTYGLGNLLETMVAEGTLPQETYRRVKGQAALSMSQRPIANPGAPMPSTGAPQQNANPPVQGARQAPDGNWYVSDPNRPGKFLKVE